MRGSVRQTGGDKGFSGFESTYSSGSSGYSQSDLLSRLYVWITLSRVPFHTVGILPLCLGFAIAWRKTGSLDWGLFALAQLAVIFIMLSTYFAGEYFDYTEDFLSFLRGKSRFAGGTGAIPGGLIDRSSLRTATVVCLSLSLFIGLFIQCYYHTGRWTIPLGALGIIGGIFYSTPPIRWVATGTGELWIGLCYGFLPVIVGFYLVTGTIDYQVLIAATPIAITIFNVILANEFPDYESDRATGKKNLLYRIGPQRGAVLYAIAVLMSWLSMIFAVWTGAPSSALVYYLVPWGLSALAAAAFLAGKWREPRWLEAMCALGILVNLGTTLALLTAFLAH